MPKNKLIALKEIQGEPRVDSRIIAQELGIESRFAIRLIEKYKSDFEEFGVVRFENAKPKKGSKGGRPEVFVFLNENQSHIYLTYAKNTPEARSLKKKFIKTFAKYKRAYVRKGELAWQQARAEGMVTRKAETDAIKKFVVYATRQGSQNAFRYYSNVTKMTYKALGFLDNACVVKGLRELLDSEQLTHLKVADNLVIKEIEKGMEGDAHYKEIYQSAKKKVESLADVVGKVPVLVGSRPVGLLT